MQCHHWQRRCSSLEPPSSSSSVLLPDAVLAWPLLVVVVEQATCSSWGGSGPRLRRSRSAGRALGGWRRSGPCRRRRGRSPQRVSHDRALQPRDRHNELTILHVAIVCFRCCIVHLLHSYVSNVASYISDASSEGCCKVFMWMLHRIFWI